MEYASFWRRLAAALIDGIPFAIVGWILGRAIDPNVANIVMLIPQWIYFAMMESSTSQATFGKQMMGIKVYSDGGGALTFGGASVRFFGKILSALILLVGYLMQPFTAKKQALHDILAHAVVVKA